MPTKYDGSCVLAKLVIAVHALGGDGARWKMHDWLMRQPKVTNIENATNYALSLTGVSDDVLQDVIGGIDVNNQMRVDIFTKNSVWKKSVPVLTVDNRFVPRWRSSAVPAQEVFEQIIQSVGGESK
jgi:shikimate kinase